MSDDKTPPKEPKADTIEAHAAALGVPAWQFAGIKARQQWPQGKQVTRAEFQKALTEWLNGPTVRGDA